ncbi:hypothetical protein PG985_010500 [Apiospora marii]|uniref:Uncharacterized protein n=1 Tax=Apiospora marii TaxID=335849 RepID=A0ABR1RZF3_9PEZI
MDVNTYAQYSMLNELVPCQFLLISSLNLLPSRSPSPHPRASRGGAWVPPPTAPAVILLTRRRVSPPRAGPPPQPLAPPLVVLARPPRVFPGTVAPPGQPTVAIAAAGSVGRGPRSRRHVAAAPVLGIGLCWFDGVVGVAAHGVCDNGARLVVAVAEPALEPRVFGADAHMVAHMPLTGGVGVVDREDVGVAREGVGDARENVGVAREIFGVAFGLGTQTAVAAAAAATAPVAG